MPPMSGGPDPIITVEEHVPGCMSTIMTNYQNSSTPRICRGAESRSRPLHRSRIPIGLYWHATESNGPIRPTWHSDRGTEMSGYPARPASVAESG